MKKMSKEEITGMAEAYQIYLMLPEETKKKIPQDFVAKMSECSNFGYGELIFTKEDIEKKALSDECVKIMAYMCLFFKE